MAIQALYRKWRPQTFDEIVGQEHVVRTLRNALASGRIHHAYLFAGPRGTGKTTTARLLAKAVNCLALEGRRPCNECDICLAINEGRLLDLIEIDAASNTGVDDVRELREKVGFRPNEARYKVYVIDEVHMLSNAAFNALLKTLEEPPEHAIFVLATTEPHKILPTVLSRCQRFDFHRIPVGKIVARLEQLAEQEGIRVERQALMLIAREATGSMRDAESLLDQLASYGDAGITVAEVRAVLGIGANETVFQVTGALIDGDIGQGLEAINSAVDQGADPRHFARQMVEHLRALLLLKLESGILPPYISDDVRPQFEEQAGAFSRRELAKAVRLFNEAAFESRGGWQPQLPLEMALIEAMPSVASGAPGRSEEGAHSHSAPSDKRAAGGAEKGSPEPSSQGRGAVQESVTDYGDVEIDDGPLTPTVVQAHWSEILDRLGQPSLAGGMSSCKPVAVEGNVVVLGFERKLHRDRVEKDDKRDVVAEVLSELFGRRLRVRCVMADQGHSPGSSGRSGDEANDGAGTSSGERLITEDPLVRAAVEDLGAQVVSS